MMNLFNDLRGVKVETFRIILQIFFVTLFVGTFFFLNTNPHAYSST
jgi:hypothetical protein